MSKKIYTNTKICQDKNLLSIAFLKRVLKNHESIKTFRYYLIAKNHFHHRSGLFSLDELTDVLSLDLKSLSNNSGNHRRRFQRQLENHLKNSILFRKAPDGRFIINSWRKIINER